MLFLHGFLDDATCWQPLMETVAQRGRRALAPFVLGSGGTRFLRADTPRAGDFPALGQDAVDFIEALYLPQREAPASVARAILD